VGVCSAGDTLGKYVLCVAWLELRVLHRGVTVDVSAISV